MWWGEFSYVVAGRDPPVHTYFDSTPGAERDPNASGPKVTSAAPIDPTIQVHSRTIRATPLRHGAAAREARLRVSSQEWTL